MRITIAVIGRLKAGPERDLYERFVARAAKTGGRLALTFATRQFPESRAGTAEARRTQEASVLLTAVPPAAVAAILDRHGENLTSEAFADCLARWRDGGSSEVVFAIGGPDGLGAALPDRADFLLAFGLMTWPHQLARIMLAEQLYRAVTILSGHPYHRGDRG